MTETIRTQWQAQYRAERIAQRRADKAANRLDGWRMWAQGMALLRSILKEEATQLSALSQADAMLAQVKRYE